MKKVLLFAVIAMFLMVPMSFAKQAISDSDLAGVTAQEGVTINFDDFVITDVQVNVQGWGDADGFGATYSEAGWVGVSIATTSAGNFVSLNGDLTIDVGSDGLGTTALQIGLPSVSIDGAMTQVIALGDSIADLTATLDDPTVAGAQVLGTAYMSGITLGTSGVLVITAH